MNALEFYTDKKFDDTIYKINNINEDTYVYFFHYGCYRYSYRKDYTFFEVCNDETKICDKNVQIYKFEKDKTYTIYFHLYNEYYNEPPRKLVQYNNEDDLTDIPDSDELSPTDDITDVPFPTDTDESDDYPSDDTDVPDTDESDDYPSDDTDVPYTDKSDDYPTDDTDEPDTTDSDESDQPYPDYGRYYYGRYAFFPILHNTLMNLDYEVYSFDEPKIVVAKNDNKQRHIVTDNLYYKYINQTDENINLDNIDKLAN